MSGAGGTIPPVLLTDKQGPNQRLRVDVAQTGFFAGREFRTFYEVVSSASDFVIKAVVPIDTILFDISMMVTEGESRISTYLGGTDGGTYDTDLPIIPTNAMTEVPQPPYESQITIATGGTYSDDGINLDVFRVKAADGFLIEGGSVAGTGTERGVGAGTYYFVVDLTGTTTGVIRARWEERV